jgi:hypothetical protein
MMADNELNDGDDGDIFVYTGGDQEVPRDVKRVKIAENVDTIPERTFFNCDQLIEVEGHKKVRKIEDKAFYGCHSLLRVSNMTGLMEIEAAAFKSCFALSELEFDKLEIIGYNAFGHCRCLQSINLPSVRRVGEYAFAYCTALTDVVFGEKLERTEAFAFLNCTALGRIAFPFKDILIGFNAFIRCENLSRVDTLAGGIHKSISSLHMESWGNEMKDEIESINQTLPNTQSSEKTGAIQQWMTRVVRRMENYKNEHQFLLKEAMTLLELALWKAKLLNEADEKKCNVDKATKKVKIDDAAARKEHRVTCGASIVIKNVFPFLALK